MTWRVINLKEKTFENKIKNYIKKSGGYVVKYFGCMYSTSGTPDLLACINGYFLAIEVKADNGEASDLQLEKIDQIRNAGGLAYVVFPSGWNRIKQIIDDLKINKFNRFDEVEIK